MAKAHEFVIIGGGVAGLCAANRLVDQGLDSLVIEASSYPSHRVCGEFFSHEALPILEQWEVAPPVTINEIHLYSHRRKFILPLPYSCGSGSRYTFDTQLCNRARRLGAEVYMNTRVERVIPGTPHQLFLSDGRVLLAKRILISTGRIAGAGHQNQLPYVGCKAHFSGVEGVEQLQIYLTHHSYIGIAPIGKDQYNVACLARADKLSRTPEETLHEILHRPGAQELLHKLNGATNLFDNWKVARLPHFGCKKVPKWPNAYFLGDAAGSIAPAAGDGLAMSISSGWLAAEYAAADDPEGYRWAWKREYAKRILWSKRLHTMMMRPALANAGITTSRLFPSVGEFLFHATRK